MDFFKVRAKKKALELLEPIPVGDAQESTWAAWEDSVAFQDSLHADFQDTVRMAITPQDTHDIDVFASVHRRGA